MPGNIHQLRAQLVSDNDSMPQATRARVNYPGSISQVSIGEWTTETDRRVLEPFEW